MLSFEERLNKLREYDLTEYQARVYLALLELGQASAGQIPAISRVPRTRIYITMSQLHEKGLVQVIPETPIKYKPVSFHDYLISKSRELKEKADMLSLNAEEISKELSVAHKRSVDTVGHFEILYGRRNVKERLLRMYSSAKSEIVSIGSSTSPARILRTTLSTLREKSIEGVQIHYGFPVTIENREATEQVSRFAKVSHLDKTPPMHFVVVDGIETMMIHRIPDDEEPFKGDDVAVWSDDKAIVNTFREISRNHLEGALPASHFNLTRPLLDSINSFMATVSLPVEPVLAGLGRSIGLEINKSMCSKSEGSIGEVMTGLSSFWKEKGIGDIRVFSKDPCVISIKNFVDCHLEGKKCQSVTGFVRSILETILSERLKAGVQITMGECNADKQECLFGIKLE